MLSIHVYQVYQSNNKSYSVLESPKQSAKEISYVMYIQIDYSNKTKSNL